MIKKQKTKSDSISPFDMVLAVIVLICLALAVLAIKNLKSDGSECLKNPLVYGAKDIKEGNNAEIMCSCNLMKPGSPTITFDDKKLVIENGPHI